MVKTLEIYSLGKFQAYNALLLSIVMLCIRSPELIITGIGIYYITK